MKKIFTLFLALLSLIPTALAGEDYSGHPWFAKEQPLFAYSEESTDPHLSFTIVLYNDGKLIQNQDHNTVVEYNFDSSFVDTISNIIDKADLSTIPSELYNGSYDGSANSFLFKEKYITAMNIILSVDDSVYVADEYKENREQEKTVYSLYSKIRKAFKDVGYDFRLNSFTPIN